MRGVLKSMRILEQESITRLFDSLVQHGQAAGQSGTNGKLSPNVPLRRSADFRDRTGQKPKALSRMSRCAIVPSHDLGLPENLGGRPKDRPQGLLLHFPTVRSRL
jgi:hypothetical protein